MWNIIKTLYLNKLLSPKFIMLFILAITRHGTNLFTLLVFAHKRFPNHIAITDNQKDVSYTVLYQQVKWYMNVLKEQFALQPKSKIAILANNDLPCIAHIIACSGLGTDLYMLNPHLSAIQISTLTEQLHLDQLLYAPQYRELALVCQLKVNLISMDDPLFDLNDQPLKTISPTFTGKIVLLTSGSTGTPKAISHKPSLFQFIGIFHALFNQLRLQTYHSVIIATPFFHGFGFATVCMSLALGKKMCVMGHFDAQQCLNLIQKNQIQVITLVPIMLQRIINLASFEQLSSLKCIICGGAVLPSTLVKETQNKLGSVLFNLYGTSETGVCTIATPDILARYPQSIGLPIKGIKLNIYDKQNYLISKPNSIGSLYISSPWRSDQIQQQMNSKDLAYQNETGYFFLVGRMDDMIVSGGENIYPVELENILYQHTAIADVCVIGIKDQEFGQRLQAFVVLKPNEQLSSTALLDWLSLRLAPHQKPKTIVCVDQLPYLAVGKPDKKQLCQLFNLTEA